MLGWSGVSSERVDIMKFWVLMKDGFGFDERWLDLLYATLISSCHILSLVVTMLHLPNNVLDYNYYIIHVHASVRSAKL